VSELAGLDAFDDDHFHDECGVFGVFHPGEDVANLTYFGLYALQHRGQESAGIAVSDGHEIRISKEMGLVSQVFDQETIDGLKGNIAIGHTRYSTTGGARLRDGSVSVRRARCHAVRRHRVIVARANSAYDRPMSRLAAAARSNETGITAVRRLASGLETPSAR